jgi:hypothetical protein
MSSAKRTVSVSIAMPESMARTIRVLAAQEDKSRSQYVREKLAEALPENCAPQPQDRGDASLLGFLDSQS